MTEDSYRRLLANDQVVNDYIAYQRRYAEQPRESDKVLISNIEADTRELEKPTIVDVGCSSGNLLRHLRNAIPRATLIGGEISQQQLDACRADASLEGIAFERLDVTDLGDAPAYDAVVVNAVLCVLDADTYAASLQSIGRVLRPGGTLHTFDWYHRFPQDITVVERARGHEHGQALYFRPMTNVEGLLRDAGFDEVDFQSFAIPVDLEEGATYGDNASGFEDLNSYTVRAEDGRRLLFRGTLYQPWCHLRARKAR